MLDMIGLLISVYMTDFLPKANVEAKACIHATWFKECGLIASAGHVLVPPDKVEAFWQFYRWRYGGQGSHSGGEVYFGLTR